MYIVKLQLIRIQGEAGFQAIVRTEKDGQPLRDATGFLPAIPPTLRQAFDHWRNSYISSGSAPNDPSSDPSTRFRDLRIQVIGFREGSPFDNSDRELEAELK